MTLRVLTLAGLLHQEMCQLQIHAWRLPAQQTQQAQQDQKSPVTTFLARLACRLTENMGVLQNSCCLAMQKGQEYVLQP